jgi:hypothetical protein
MILGAASQSPDKNLVCPRKVFGKKILKLSEINLSCQHFNFIWVIKISDLKFIGK